MSTTSREEIRGWVQTLAIIIAGIWAAYTFILKEYIFPQTAPINITMDLEAKRIDQAEVGASNPKSTFPVQIKVVAKNPSTRPIYLLSSVWWAHGLIIEKHETDEKQFGESVVNALNNATGDYAERYIAVPDKSLVAAGSLLTDTSLKPNEVVTRTLMIYLPPKYDKLEIVTTITTSGKDPEGKLGLLWAKPGERKWYRLAKDGAWQELDDKKFTAYELKFEVQDSEAKSEISLPR